MSIWVPDRPQEVWSEGWTTEFFAGELTLKSIWLADVHHQPPVPSCPLPIDIHHFRGKRSPEVQIQPPPIWLFPLPPPFRCVLVSRRNFFPAILTPSFFSVFPIAGYRDVDSNFPLVFPSSPNDSPVSESDSAPIPYLSHSYSHSHWSLFLTFPLPVPRGDLSFM